LWVRTLPHASQLGEGPALAAAADGSIFVNGRFAADAATPRSPGDLSLARLLPDGSVAWNQRLGDGGLTTVAAVGDVTIGGSIAGNVLAVLGGADIVRVHDVAETVQALRVTQAIRAAAHG